MFELTIISEFEAAHRLPDYPGKCCRLHGHNWKVEVTVAGAKLDKLGMLVDFKEIKNEVHIVLGGLDHYYLNEIAPFNTINPTAENIARHVFTEIANCPLIKSSDRGLKVIQVKVWESPNSAASYREG